MEIRVRIAMGEQEPLELLNAIVRINARVLSERDDVPLLYDTGVVYRLEDVETWSDALATLLAGHEDCDSLATWRAGELLARGWRALRPGDDGYELALELRPESIEADVVLRTRLQAGQTGGLYHVVTRYVVDGQICYDDPSVRLGMRAGLIDPAVLERWAALGVSARCAPMGIT